MAINKITNIIITTIVIVFLGACAHSVPPSGGPEDKTPPEIVKFLPENLTKNFKENEITIEFNKYMNKQDVAANIFISPPLKYELDWSGKELTIEFIEAPDTNKTYSLNIGTDYSDLKGNRPIKSFSLIFSFGSIIDTGRIEGKIIAQKPEGSFAYAYLLDGIEPDTLNIGNTPPDYITQIGTSGEFAIQALKNGNYRIFAVVDEFRDYVYNSGIDAFGAATNDYLVAGGKAEFAEIKLGPKEDFLQPALYEAMAKNERLIELSFSEYIDESSIFPGNFTVSDSVGSEEFPVSAAFPSKEDGSIIMLCLDKSMEGIKAYKLTASTELADSSGNKLQDTASTVFFYGESLPDTLIPKIERLPVRDSAEQVSLLTGLQFRFNTGISKNGLNEAILFINLSDSSAVEFTIENTPSDKLKLIPSKLPEPDTWYRISLDMSKIRGGNGLFGRDTVVSVTFLTEDSRNFTSLSGEVTGNIGCVGDLFILMRNETNPVFLNTKVEDGVWLFEVINNGQYKVELYCDSNGNGKYDYGSSFPFKFAEQFKLFPDDVEVKARWGVEDIKLTFDK